MGSFIKQRPLAVAALVAAVLLVIGTLTFAGPCIHEDGSAAACHPASHAIVAAGVAGIIASLAALLVRSPKPAGCIALVAAVAGLFAAASPGTLFGLCMMQTMRCWVAMRPFALVCGGALFLCGLIAAIALFRAREGRAS